MELFVWIIVGILATWRFTCDFTHPGQLYGPFRLYERIRIWIVTWEWVPDFVKENLDCPYCVSFCVGHAIALLLPIYGAFGVIRQIIVYAVVSWAISGAVTLIYWLRGGDE